MKTAFYIFACGVIGMVLGLKFELAGPFILGSLLVCVIGVNYGFLYLKKLEAQREITVLGRLSPDDKRKTVA